VLDGLVLELLDRDLTVGLALQVQRSLNNDLVVLVHALEGARDGVLRQSGALVVVEARDAVRLLDLVLGAEDHVVVLDADADLAGIDVLRHVKAHGDLLGAVGAVNDLREEIADLELLGLTERDLDDEMTIVSHEADELLWHGVLWQAVGLLELLHGEVICSFDLVVLVSGHDEYVILELGLDRLGLEAGAVDGDAVLLWHTREQWQLVEEVWLVEPVEVAGDGAVQLIEWIVQVQRGVVMRRGRMVRMVGTVRHDWLRMEPRMGVED
jgi:hypothetical protein